MDSGAPSLVGQVVFGPFEEHQEARIVCANERGDGKCCSHGWCHERIEVAQGMHQRHSGLEAVRLSCPRPPLVRLAPGPLFFASLLAPPLHRISRVAQSLPRLFRPALCMALSLWFALFSSFVAWRGPFLPFVLFPPLLAVSSRACLRSSGQCRVPSLSTVSIHCLGR